MSWTAVDLGAMPARAWFAIHGFAERFEQPTFVIVIKLYFDHDKHVSFCQKTKRGAKVVRAAPVDMGRISSLAGIARLPRDIDINADTGGKAEPGDNSAFARETRKDERAWCVCEMDCLPLAARI